jgi:hypothetical protein
MATGEGGGGSGGGSGSGERKSEEGGAEGVSVVEMGVGRCWGGWLG